LLRSSSVRDSRRFFPPLRPMSAAVHSFSVILYD
jgi:hypothetical protein